MNPTMNDIHTTAHAIKEVFQNRTEDIKTLIKVMDELENALTTSFEGDLALMDAYTTTIIRLYNLTYHLDVELLRDQLVNAYMELIE